MVITPDFQHILRILNTNIDGTRKTWVAMTAIQGVGRRFSIMVCKKAEIDLKKRAGELTNDEIERIVAIIQNPMQFKIPVWFLNRKKDFKTGKNAQIVANNLQAKLREDLERLKKIRCVFVYFCVFMWIVVYIVVCVIGGDLLYVVNIPRPLDVVDELLALKSNYTFCWWLFCLSIFYI